jgi:superfamily II DNA/RNA helicase
MPCAQVMHGDVAQTQRDLTLAQFRKGQASRM